MNMKKILYIAIAAAAILTSCAKEVEVVAPTGLSVDQSSITLNIGEYKELNATISPANATSNYVKWTSDDTKIATVNGFGTVVAVGSAYDFVGNGVAIITATTADGKISSTVKVTVKPNYIKTLEGDFEEMNAKVRETLNVFEHVEITPDDATRAASYGDVEWFEFSSSDETVATVDATGLVTFLAEGDVTITVKAEDTGKTCEFGFWVEKPNDIDQWVGDEAGELEFNGGTTDVEAAEGHFLSYKGGKLIWPANETGMFRSDTLTMVGAQAIISQIGPKEFYGDYTFTAKFFSVNSAIVGAGANKSITVTFGDPLGGEETLEDHDGSVYTNNVGITGFYDTAVMNACVDIDYDERTVRLGLFCDARKAQKVTKSNIAGYEYVCFLPGLATDPGAGQNWGAPYDFVPADLDSTKDYEWIWYGDDDELNGFSWNSFTNKQYADGDKVTSPNCIIAISCALCNSEEVTSSTAYGAWNVVYQANTNNDNVVPTTIVKK